MTAGRIALKVDVDTARGTCEGVPRLIELLHRRGADATFLFSLGPDHTGRAIRRVLRRGFFSKVSRTSVVSHYGLRTLLYGTVLPGPDIGRRHAAQMRAARDAGFEVGVHCWDHVAWQDRVARADARWTEQQLRLAIDRFGEVFGHAPRVHGAAGWQMNAHALQLLDAYGFALASDARGTHPFVPVVAGQALRCPQLPTTLPTLDELIGREGWDRANVADYLLRVTAQPCPTGHVYTLHAELEGMKLAPTFDRLLAGWRAQGHALVSLSGYARGFDCAQLPRHRVTGAAVPGRSGTVLVQGAAA